MRKFYLRLLCVIAILLFQITLKAQVSSTRSDYPATKIRFGCIDTSATWTGIIDNNWNNPGNWSTGCVPTATVHVLLQPGSNPLIGSDGGSIKGLTMQAGATLGLSTDAVLEVIGNIVNNGTILSGPSSPTNGKVVLNAFTQQNISGSGSFSHVEVENSVGVAVLTNLRFKSLIIVANGKLTVTSSVNLDIRQ